MFKVVRLVVLCSRLMLPSLRKTLETQTMKLNATEKFGITVPGTLVIDTPGHGTYLSFLEWS